MKLHLPKLFLAAVMAAMATTPAEALTGWGNSYTLSGETYFIDSTEAVTINAAADKPDAERINVVADVAGLDATASISVKSDITMAICSNPWPDYHLFNSLVLTSLEVENGGSINLEVNNNATVQILQVSGTLASVNNTGTLVLAGGVSSGTTITNSGALTVADSISLSQVSSNTGTLTLRGTLTETDVTVTGGTLAIASESATISGKLYSAGGNITLGDGTNSGTATVVRVELGDANNGGNSQFNVANGYTLKVTGNANTILDEPNLYKTNSFVVSEWNNTTTMNVNGTILAENAAVLTGDSGVVINIENGGTLATKGLGRSHPGKTAVSTINLKEGGKLILGDMGLDYSGYVNTNISGGTIGLAAESVTIAESLNIAGNLTIDTNRYSYGDSGLTQGGTGGTLILNGNLTGGGSLSATGSGTLQLGKIDSGVSIATGTAGMNFTGTLTMAEGTTFTAGSGAFTIDASSIDNFIVGEGVSIVDKDGNSATNGFSTGARTLIEGGTISGEFTVTCGEATYTINNESRTFGSADSIDLNTWYITSGSSTLSEIYTQSATAGVSAATGTTLNVDTALASGTGIELTGGATMNISEEQSLSAASLTTNGHAVTLEGKGTYTINSGNATNISIAEGWSGTVELFGFRGANFDLSSYGRGNTESRSTVSIKDYEGYFINDGNATKNIEANLVLTNGSYAAIELINGYSGCTYNFNGTVSGNGNFLVAKNLNGGKMTFSFSGNVSGWSGQLASTQGEHNFVFTGDATVINAQLIARNQGRANITFDHKKDVTVNSSFTNEANGIHVTVSNTGTTTFSDRERSMQSLKVTEGTTANFNGSVSVTTLEALGNLSFTAQDALNVTNLTGGNVGTLTIKDGAGSVSASGSATLTGGATINASLTLGNGATLEMDGLVTDAVTVNGALTFGGKLTMGDKLQEIVLEMAAWPTPELVLFDGLTSFTFGETLVTAGAEVQASEYFSNISDETLYVTYRQVDNVGSLVMFSIVPEPATTTLSLLALAGLAARRRRR